MSEYTKQAEEFAKKVGLKMKVLGFVWEHPAWDDNYKHAKFKVRFSRNGKQWTLDFYQSRVAGKKQPSIYDVLACVQKCDPGNFEQFCWEFGFNSDSRKAERLYEAVVDEYENVVRLFSDVMNELCEIL